MAVTIGGITSTDIEETYEVFFFGELVLTTVTHDHTAVSEWISDREFFHRRRLNRLIVGLDVEWRPSFSRQQNPVATLQLCVGSRCLIYQLTHTNYIPTSLVDFLSDENYTFVGVGIKSDLEKLDRDHQIGSETNAVDLAKLAANEYDRKEMKGWGLKALASFVLERDMEKPRRVTLSRWDERWLTEDQVKYACVDAYVSFKIGKFLNASDYRYYN